MNNKTLNVCNKCIDENGYCVGTKNILSCSFQKCWKCKSMKPHLCPSPASAIYKIKLHATRI